MTKKEQRQFIKNTALNKIRKMYHPLTKHNYTYYPNEGSIGEQMNEDVRHIIEKMEKDLNKLKQHKTKQSYLSNNNNNNNHLYCSKCGKTLSTKWEEEACYIKLEIGIDCCSTEVLFGKDEKIGFKHPAIKEGSGYQRVFIESKKESDYKLCWDCHRDFVKQVGNFLKSSY